MIMLIYLIIAIFATMGIYYFTQKNNISENLIICFLFACMWPLIVMLAFISAFGWILGIITDWIYDSFR